jgi:hypothetical protein
LFRCGPATTPGTAPLDGRFRWKAKGDRIMDNAAAQRDSRFHSLLARGLSPEKAARILAAETGIGEPEAYEDWTDEELVAHAEQMGVAGHLDMTRAELIAALRDH